MYVILLMFLFIDSSNSFPSPVTLSPTQLALLIKRPRCQYQNISQIICKPERKNNEETCVQNNCTKIIYWPNSTFCKVATTPAPNCESLNTTCLCPTTTTSTVRPSTTTTTQSSTKTSTGTKPTNPSSESDTNTTTTYEKTRPTTTGPAASKAWVVVVISLATVLLLVLITIVLFICHKRGKLPFSLKKFKRAKSPSPPQNRKLSSQAGYRDLSSAFSTLTPTANSGVTARVETPAEAVDKGVGVHSGHVSQESLDAIVLSQPQAIFSETATDSDQKWRQTIEEDQIA